LAQRRQRSRALAQLQAIVTGNTRETIGTAGVGKASGQCDCYSRPIRKQTNNQTNKQTALQYSESANRKPKKAKAVKSATESATQAAGRGARRDD
jgi:hypothetical protein